MRKAIVMTGKLIILTIVINGCSFIVYQALWKMLYLGHLVNKNKMRSILFLFWRLGNSL